MSTNTAAQQFAAQALEQGDQRREVACTLMEMFGVSQATAYRIISKASAGQAAACDAEEVCRTADGRIDLPAEAERQYVAAVAREDEKSALRWFSVLEKLQHPS
jgi:hypothetical protein